MSDRMSQSDPLRRFNQRHQYPVCDGAVAIIESLEALVKELNQENDDIKGQLQDHLIAEGFKIGRVE